MQMESLKIEFKKINEKTGEASCLTTKTTGEASCLTTRLEASSIIISYEGLRLPR